MIEQIKTHLWFGFSNVGRAMLRDADTGRVLRSFDGFWIVSLTEGGVVELICIFGLLLIPVFRAWQAFPRIRSPMERALVAGLSLMVTINVVDLLPNSTTEGYLTLLSGALAGVVPGILREQIPKIFGKLLYGSKFHRLRMSRGQQGIGISAAALYAQLTTGQPVLITSRTSARAKPHRYRIGINLAKNAPEDKEVDIPASEQVPQGTRVELEIEGRYQRHGKSVDQYLKQTAVANPHARITFRDPEGEQVVHERVSKALPEPTREIKPHPYGVELGVLIKMMRDSSSRTVKGFLQTDFSRVSARIAKQILKAAGISEGYHPKTIARDQADNLYEAIQETKIMAPPTDCLSPIGEKQLEKGLEKEFDLEFVTSATRPPTVYRGNPFQIEAAVGYGGELPADEPAQVLRFANRVPLLYQGGACAITKAVAATAWRNYKLSQPRGSLPVGPLVIVVHMASVWVPFTSEAKEAVANYDVILQEVRRALQECGRRIGVFINKRKRIADEARKLSFITLYLPHIGIALQEILKLTDKERDQTCRKLERILERTRKSS